MTRYLKLILLFSLLSLVLLCAASIWLDPYGIYPHHSDAFPRKVAAADKGRTIKPYQAAQVAPYTVLVGNSRIEIGMPRQHDFYQKKPVYNMGLPGAGISMQYAYALAAIADNADVKQVVIALDLLDFASRPTQIVTAVDTSAWAWRVTANADATLNVRRKKFGERLSLLFSLSTMLDSLQTIVLQQRNVNALDRFGFNDGRVYQFHVATEGFAALYQQKAAELDARLSRQPLQFTPQSYHLRALDDFIGQLKSRDITVYLLINPYQQPYLDKLEQYQLKDDLHAWKQQLVALAAQHQLALYDFAINSTPVTEVVDPASRNPGDSPYFWEPAHYRPALGSLILDILQSGDCQQLCQKYVD